MNDVSTLFGLYPVMLADLNQRFNDEIKSIYVIVVNYQMVIGTDLRVNYQAVLFKCFVVAHEPNDSCYDNKFIKIS